MKRNWNVLKRPSIGVPYVHFLWSNQDDKFTKDIGIDANMHSTSNKHQYKTFPGLPAHTNIVDEYLKWVWVEAQKIFI